MPPKQFLITLRSGLLARHVVQGSQGLWTELNGFLPFVAGLRGLLEEQKSTETKELKVLNGGLLYQIKFP